MKTEKHYIHYPMPKEQPLPLGEVIGNIIVCISIFAIMYIFVLFAGAF